MELRSANSSANPNNLGCNSFSNSFCKIIWEVGQMPRMKRLKLKKTLIYNNNNIKL